MSFVFTLVVSVVLTQSISPDKSGSPTIDELVSIARSAPLEQRLFALDSLSKIGPPASRSLPVFIEAITSDAAQLRLSCGYFILRFGDSAIPYLARVLEDEASSSQSRVVAASSLGDLGPKATRHLTRCAADTDTEVRATVISSLGGQRGNEVIRVLLNACEDEDPGVRECAAESLGMAVSHRKECATALAILVKDAHVMVRVKALTALQEFDDCRDAVLPVVLDAIDDDVWIVRCHAMEAIAEFGIRTPRITNAISERLNDETHEVRVRAINSVIKLRLRSPEITQRLITILGKAEASPSVQYGAAMAIGDMGQSASNALPALRQLATSEYQFLRDEASNAIAKITALNRPCNSHCKRKCRRFKRPVEIRRERKSSN